MKKKIICLLGTLTAAVVLAGCGVECNYTVDKSGKVSLKENVYFTNEEFDSIYQGADAQTLKESGYVGAVTVDGTEYQLFTEEEDDYDLSQLEEEFVLTSTEFVYAAAEQNTSSEESAMTDEEAQELAAELSEAFSFCDISITFPYEIVYTNGTLSKDKKTVTFEGMGKNATDTAIYAYTSKSDKMISLSDVDDKGYTTKSKIKVVTDKKIKSITVNGKKQTSKTIELKKDGKYTIKVTTKDFSNTFTVYRDTTKPTVSGVKNEKTYTKAVTIKFSDKTSGVQKATLNGKTIKTGKKVSKKGEYTLKVTDKAGNTKTVKFTIK